MKLSCSVQISLRSVKHVFTSPSPSPSSSPAASPFLSLSFSTPRPSSRSLTVLCDPGMCCCVVPYRVLSFVDALLLLLHPPGRRSLFVRQLEESKKKDVKKEVPKEICLLDGKRAMNTSIAIARIKMSYAETRQAIMNMEETALSSNVLQSLQVCLRSWFRFVIGAFGVRVLCAPVFACVRACVRVVCVCLRVFACACILLNCSRVFASGWV